MAMNDVNVHYDCDDDDDNDDDCATTTTFTTSVSLLCAHILQKKRGKKFQIIYKRTLNRFGSDQPINKFNSLSSSSS